MSGMTRALRALRIGARLAGRHWWRPWRSPLLRWRLETYGVADHRGRLLTAEEITAGVFLRFVCRQRRQLWRFLLWAADQEVL